MHISLNQVGLILGAENLSTGPVEFQCCHNFKWGGRQISHGNTVPHSELVSGPSVLLRFISVLSLPYLVFLSVCLCAAFFFFLSCRKCPDSPIPGVGGGFFFPLSLPFGEALLVLCVVG